MCLEEEIQQVELELLGEPIGQISEATIKEYRDATREILLNYMQEDRAIYQLTLEKSMQSIIG